MNSLSCTLRVLLLGSLPGLASAAVITYTWNSDFADSGVVPDGNPLGWSNTRNLSGITTTSLTDVNVSLSISGGYNGDLFVYLQHDSGIAILLNRPGKTSLDPFGYDDSGFNVTFDDSAANGDSHINFTGDLILGGASWRPDGRAVNPALVLVGDTRSSLLNGLNGLNPNGDWTLFVADMSGGDLTQSQVASWGLTLTAVPEPCEVAALGLLIGSSLFLRTRPKPRASPAQTNFPGAALGHPNSPIPPDGHCPIR